MILVRDVIDPAALDAMIEAGYVREQVHPSEPLRILNYTAKCQYDRAWNDTTRACRGLIYHAATGEVVARPWPKFHNYGEHEEGTLDLDESAEVTDKMDGSLGIAYRTSSGWAIATRGSFASSQAVRATDMLRRQHPWFNPEEGVTYLFEIVYRENRIVIDYGDFEGLTLLGGVVIDTGAAISPGGLSGWDGPVVEAFEACTLREALALEPRPGAEGVVVRMERSGTFVKLKQEDYLRLHRLVTGLSAIRIWERAAVAGLQNFDLDAAAIGRALQLDVVLVREHLEAAPDGDWLPGVLNHTPDEFAQWVVRADETLRDAWRARWNFYWGIFEELDLERISDDRKRAAALIQEREPDERAALFAALDNKGHVVASIAWRDVRPATEVFAEVSEDVA